jgi:hypothetical protein
MFVGSEDCLVASGLPQPLCFCSEEGWGVCFCEIPLHYATEMSIGTVKCGIEYTYKAYELDDSIRNRCRVKHPSPSRLFGYPGTCNRPDCWTGLPVLIRQFTIRGSEREVSPEGQDYISS